MDHQAVQAKVHQVVPAVQLDQEDLVDQVLMADPAVVVEDLEDKELMADPAVVVEDMEDKVLMADLAAVVLADTDQVVVAVLAVAMEMLLSSVMTATPTQEMAVINIVMKPETESRPTNKEKPDLQVLKTKVAKLSEVLTRTPHPMASKLKSLTQLMKMVSYLKEPIFQLPLQSLKKF